MIYNLIGTILMVFFFGFCIFIHEFGHLLMARAMRLFVQSFSIGFGPVLWKKVYRGIEYRLSLIPFGGYVMIPQLEPTDHPSKADGSPLPPATPFERIMTAFAGPLANIISAFLISFVVFAIGDYREKVDPNGVEVGEVPQVFKFNGKEYEVPESKAGLRAGDIITAVNGTKITRGQRQLIREIIFAPHGKVVLDILRDGKPLQISYKLNPHPDPRFRGVGMPFFKCVRKTIIYKLVAVDPAQSDSIPAARAGLKKGDVVVKVNGQRVISPGWLVEYLHNLNPDPEKKPYQAALFTIKRKVNGAWRELQIKVEPAAVTVKDPKTGAEKKVVRFGIVLDVEQEFYRPSPWREFQRTLYDTYRGLVRIIDPDNPLTLRSMSSFLGIGAVMQKSFSASAEGAAHSTSHLDSLRAFMPSLRIVAMISFALAFFNLFPFPVLDGGHIILGLWEMVMRKKVSLRVLQTTTYVFMILLLAVALYVTYNDVKSLFLSQEETPPTSSK